jgi:hypothetical protein
MLHRRIHRVAGTRTVRRVHVKLKARALKRIGMRLAGAPDEQHHSDDEGKTGDNCDDDAEATRHSHTSGGVAPERVASV